VLASLVGTNSCQWKIVSKNQLVTPFPRRLLFDYLSLSIPQLYQFRKCATPLAEREIVRGISLKSKFRIANQNNQKDASLYKTPATILYSSQPEVKKKKMKEFA
jgi:hypothetical protein